MTAKNPEHHLLRRIYAIVIAGLLFSVIPTISWADELREWNRRFEAAKKDMAEGRPEKAIRKLDFVLREFGNLAGPGEANERNFGTFLVYRAVANQQAGLVDDARWDWDLAVNFLPEARTLDLSPFGDSGRSLKEYSDQRALEEAEDDAAHAAAGEEPDLAGITPPRVRRTIKPKYTYGAIHFDVKGALVVTVVITEEGVARHPRVTEKLPAPGLSYTALETIRQWRFEPATKDGKPIAVHYKLRISYTP